MKILGLFLLIAFTALSTMFGARPVPQVKAWKVESYITGGMIGQMKRYSLESNGRVMFEDTRVGRKAETTAPQGVVEEIGRLVAGLNLADAKRPEKLPQQQCCDAVFQYVRIYVDGKQYDIELDGNFETDAEGNSKPRRDFLLLFSEEEKAAVEQIKGLVKPLFTRELDEGAVETKLDLGTQWNVREGVEYKYGVPSEQLKADWTGVLTRRGSTNVFDAAWTRVDTGEVLKDEVRIEELPGHNIRMTRNGKASAGLRKTFEASYFPSRPKTIMGNATDTRPDFMWDAVIK